MISTKVFELDGVNKVFGSDVPIKGIDFVAVYINNVGLPNDYERVNTIDYNIINDSVVFNTAPTGIFLRLVVTTERSELLNTPTNTATVATNIEKVNKVAENIDKLFDYDKLFSGDGSPEGVVTADVGSLYTNNLGGVGTTLYVKEVGSDSSGWSAK